MEVCFYGSPRRAREKDEPRRSECVGRACTMAGVNMAGVNMAAHPHLHRRTAPLGQVGLKAQLVDLRLQRSHPLWQRVQGCELQMKCGVQSRACCMSVCVCKVRESKSEEGQRKDRGRGGGAGGADEGQRVMRGGGAIAEKRAETHAQGVGMCRALMRASAGSEL
eukprot:19571-Chlamydomonas_euryale.AAC.7